MCSEGVIPSLISSRPAWRLVQPSLECYGFLVTLKARVRDGRLVIDEATDLPDGTEVELLPLDPGDWLDDDDRAALDAALRASDADIAAGRLVDADEVLRDLRSP